MEKYIVLAVAGAMLLTVGPTLWHIFRDERIRTAIFTAVSDWFKGRKK